MIAVKLGKCLIDPTTGMVYFETEDDARATIASINAELNHDRPSTQPGEPLLYANAAGQVLINGAAYKFRGKQLKLLRRLSMGAGRCTRLDALNYVYTQAEQMTSLKHADGAMEDLRGAVNRKLEAHRLFIDSTPQEYFLRKF